MKYIVHLGSLAVEHPDHDPEQDPAELGAAPARVSPHYGPMSREDAETFAERYRDRSTVSIFPVFDPADAPR